MSVYTDMVKDIALPKVAEMHQTFPRPQIEDVAITGGNAGICV